MYKATTDCFSTSLTMIRTVVILSIITYSVAYTPVEEHQHVKIYKLSDIDSINRVRSQRAPRSGTLSITEIPYNGTIAEDDGGNFGDVVFPSGAVNKNGTLTARDTIINTYASENLLVMYDRWFANVSYIEDFQLLNFGRQRGWTTFAGIWHASGLVAADIVVPAGSYIRMFAETYIRV